MLQVKDLRMYYRVPSGWLRAVDGVTFKLDRGESLGIVGESGSGKSSLAYSILRVLPPNGRIVGGEVILNGENLTELSEHQLRRKIRWKKISMVFQSALNSLDPVRRVGNQLIDALKFHQNISTSEAKRRVEKLFQTVGIPSSRIKSYPHELSGGMKQRVAIAMSFLCDPEVLIADEPTTALDVVMQFQIMNKLKDMQRKLKLGFIFISHDIAVVTAMCEKSAVMYGGEIIELASSSCILNNAAHPYSIGLMRAMPRLRNPSKELVSIPGTPPRLVGAMKGCKFAPRCPRVESVCLEVKPDLINVNSSHSSACHFADDPDLKAIRFSG